MPTFFEITHCGERNARAFPLGSNRAKCGDDRPAELTIREAHRKHPAQAVQEPQRIRAGEIIWRDDGFDQPALRQKFGAQRAGQKAAPLGRREKTAAGLNRDIAARELGDLAALVEKERIEDFRAFGNVGFVNGAVGRLVMQKFVIA